MEVVSAETSTPRAKALIDALVAAPWFDLQECHVTSRELRAILSSESISEITRPRVEPWVDVLEDLWQLNHLSASYIGRALSAAILLAYGMMENSAVSIVAAALFLPFLPQILAVSFGLWVGDRGLASHGLRAISVSALTCVGAGSLVALLHGGALTFSGFQSPLAGFGISLVIGIAAGLAIADDAGSGGGAGGSVPGLVRHLRDPGFFGSSHECGTAGGIRREHRDDRWSGGGSVCVYRAAGGDV